MRRLSDSLETFSPALDRDLEDLVLVDLGDIDFDGASIEEAVEKIATTMEDTAVAPALDPNEITAAAAAKIVRDAVLLFGVRK